MDFGVFLPYKCFAALFGVNGDYKTQNRKSNSKQNTSPQSYNTQINILPFLGLAQSATEQPGQGATPLGWPKSIYYTGYPRKSGYDRNHNKTLHLVYLRKESGASK